MSTNPRTAANRVAALRLRVERIQAAKAGSPELDALIGATLAEMADTVEPMATTAWSTDLDAALALLPPDHDFSLGLRDDVCWAWIQPTDDWQPAEHESRHDHPAGSGLVVANTPMLAMACAAMLVRIATLARGTGGNETRPALNLTEAFHPYL